MKVSTFIDVANIHNNTIWLWSKNSKNPGSSNCFYRGMEWELLRTSCADFTFKKLFGVVGLDIPKGESDAIHIEVEETDVTYENASNYFDVCAWHENLNVGSDRVCVGV